MPVRPPEWPTAQLSSLLLPVLDPYPNTIYLDAESPNNSPQGKNPQRDVGPLCPLFSSTQLTTPKLPSRHPLAAVALRPRASSVTHAIPTVRIDNAIDMVTILC